MTMFAGPAEWVSLVHHGQPPENLSILGADTVIDTSLGGISGFGRGPLRLSKDVLQAKLAQHNITWNGSVAYFPQHTLVVINPFAAKHVGHVIHNGLAGAFQAWFRTQYTPYWDVLFEDHALFPLHMWRWQVPDVHNPLDVYPLDASKQIWDMHIPHPRVQRDPNAVSCFKAAVFGANNSCPAAYCRTPLSVEAAHALRNAAWENLGLRDVLRNYILV